MFVIEFLHRVVDILEQYFNDCTESNIKEHYVVVYEVRFPKLIELEKKLKKLLQLLDEVLDNGYPLATEPNILQELIKPPNLLRSVVNTVTGKSK